MMTLKSHFMHQSHALVLTPDTSDYTYLCNGCKTLGNGMNFRCQPCNFNMHEFCIDCPRQLASFLHPQHSLNLLVQSSELATSLTTCDVCGDGVNGLFYCCQYCNFNVHPLCTQFPRFLCHAVHGLHQLEFQKPYVDAACSACGDVCDSWRYRCGECDGFDVHVDCVTKPCFTTSTLTPPPYAADSTYGDSTSRRLPPYAGTYTYEGVICSPSPIPNSNPFNNYNPTYAYHSDTNYCAGWCGECDGFDVHVDSVTKPCVTTSTLTPQPRASNSAYGGSTSRRLPPYAGIYTYGGVICSPSPIPNPNSFNNYNPTYAYHSNTNYWAGRPPNTNGQIPYGSNMQNVHSHHVTAQNVQSNSSQGHGFAKIGSKIFRIVSTLTLGVVSNVIFGALTA